MENITLSTTESNPSRFKTEYFPQADMVKYYYKPFNEWFVFNELYTERLYDLAKLQFEFEWLASDVAAVINKPLTEKVYYHCERIN